MKNPYRLTRREREILDLAIPGWQDKEIAKELGISQRTVSNHLYHAYRKLGVPNRTAAAYLLRRISKEIV